MTLLATTALEWTWGDDEPILFLGEWCKLYDRRAQWSHRQHEVVPYHWDDRAKLLSDHDDLKTLHDRLLSSLSNTLNRLHGLDRTDRYWRILLDPWLVAYVAVVFDRWECVRTAFARENHLEIIAADAVSGPRPPTDYYGFINTILGDEWNQELFAEIISQTQEGRCTARRGVVPVDPRKSGALAGTAGVPRNLKWRLARTVDAMLGRLARRNRAVFVAAYFPFSALVKLNLKLGQVPCLFLKEFDWPLELADESDKTIRNSFHDLFLEEFSPTDDFEAFLIRRISRDMPKVLIERFKNLGAAASANRLRPSVILTANAHWYNELFKRWSAEWTESGVKLVILDHGGSIHPLFDSMNFEEDIADVRSTWVQPYHRKHVRLPANKLIGSVTQSSKRKVLVIGNEMPRYCYRATAAPISGQTLVGFEMVCKFYESLNPDAQNDFVVKPYTNIGWNTRQRFADCLGPSKVSNDVKLQDAFVTAKILICTYPNTTFSEAMASGLPTILLYPRRFWETVPDFDDLLRTLRNARLVFEDATTAAKHVNDIWAEPDLWWNSHEVRAARDHFRRVISGYSPDWLDSWAQFVRDLIAESPAASSP